MADPRPHLGSPHVDDLDADTSLDTLAEHSPILRAMLLVSSIGRRQLPAEVLDAVETVGELRSWVEEQSVLAPGHPLAHPPAPGWPLRSPRAELRAIAPVDLGAIHAAFNDPSTGWRLPSRGRTVLPSAVERALDGADLQLIGAARVKPEVAMSLMALNRYDPANRTADLTVVGLTRTTTERQIWRPPRGIRFETIAMFISHAFHTMDLFKITASIPEYNWPYFEHGVDHFFVQEGLMRKQLLAGGHRHDVRQIAVFRESWSEIEPALADAFCGVMLPKPGSR